MASINIVSHCCDRLVEMLYSMTQQNANYHHSFKLLYEPTDRRTKQKWVIIKILIKPRWEEPSQGMRKSRSGLIKGAFCWRVEGLWALNGTAGRPSALSPDSRASRPWFLPSVARSSHFQQGNKSGLYGPGGVHCTPDGLLKGHITQRGPCSLRDAWSQRNSGGTGGLHCSTYLPPTQSVCQPARLAQCRPAAIPHRSLARNLETPLSSLCSSFSFWLRPDFISLSLFPIWCS